MNVTEQFEKKLPKLVVEGEIGPLETYAGQVITGTLVLKNVGGGLLTGRVYGGPYLALDKTTIRNNETRLKYTLDVGGQDIGTLNTQLVIATNGGEEVIALQVVVKPAALQIGDIYIETLQQFYEFWKDNQSVGKKAFLGQAFMVWLLATDYAYMDIYEQFRKDPIKERGLNNFFVFNKLKTNATLSIVSEDIEVLVNPLKPKTYVGTLTIKREGQGYIDDAIQSNVDWISLEKENIITADFKETDRLEIPFRISKDHMTKKVQYGTLSLMTGVGTVNLKIKTLKLLDVTLVKNHQSHKDTLYLKIVNNGLEPVTIDLKSADAFIRLPQERYVVEETLEVPFTVKLSTLQLAQKSIKKVPIFESAIRVKATFSHKKFYQDVQLTLGDFH